MIRTRPFPEPKSMKMNSAVIDIQAVQHFVEERRLGGLVGRVEQSKNPGAPAYRGARRVHAMIPVEVDIAVSLATTAWRGVTQKLPTLLHQASQRREESVA